MATGRGSPSASRPVRPGGPGGGPGGRGCACLIPAVLGYYISDLLAGIYDSISPADPTGPHHLDLAGLAMDVAFWTVASFVISAVSALVVVAVRRGGAIGLSVGASRRSRCVETYDRAASSALQ